MFWKSSAKYYQLARDLSLVIMLKPGVGFMIFLGTEPCVQTEAIMISLSSKIKKAVSTLTHCQIASHTAAA